MSTTATRLPRSAGSTAASNVKRFTLADISSKGSDLPNRYGLHAVEGWGKTSLATHGPKPVFLQSRGETGLETLIQSGQVKETAHFPQADTWEDAGAQVRFLIDEEHPYKMLVIDTVNGLERLCHEFVCHRDFGDDWGDKGFTGYMRGYEVSLAEWRLFLNDLDELRSIKRMTIFLLAHTRVKGFKNPDGPDYDRYMPDMHEKTWGLTHKWLDAVFFGNFETIVKTGKTEDATKKGKASGGNIRVLYAQRTSAFDAKNRFGMPEEIEMGDSSAEAWSQLIKAIKEGKKATAENGGQNDGQ